MMARQGGLASWQQNNLRFMDDDDDQDSDTDSKLSGSAIVDSVMKRLRNKGHFKDHPFISSGEFALDPIRDHSISEHDEELSEEHWEGDGRRGPRPDLSRSGRHGPPSYMSNGYSDSSHSPRMQRRNVPGHSSSPRNARRRDYEQAQMGMYPGRKEVLSPVPETTSSGAHVVEISGPSSKHSKSHEALPYNYQLEASRYGDMEGGATGDIHLQGGYHPPQQRRSSLGSQSGTSAHSHSGSGGGGSGYGPVSIPPHGVSYSHSSAVTSGYGAVSIPPHNISPAHSSRGYGAPTMGMVHTHPASGYGAVSIPSYSMSPSHTTRGYGAVSIPSQGAMVHSHSGGLIPGTGIPTARIGTAVPPPALISHNRNRSWHTNEVQTNAELAPGRTPPPRRANYQRHEIPRDASYHSNIHSETSGSRYTDATSQELLDYGGGSTIRSDTSQTREPNLNDVVDFLSSEDAVLVSNAASYLQHLAYGDDSMKTKIRQFGAIPVLVSQLRNPDTKVQIAVLGALRNLSYGRANEENKLQMAGEHGLPEIMLALQMSRVPEIKDLLTGVIWNLSSCEELKLRIIKSCLQDMVDLVLVPYSGWRVDLARDRTARPSLVQWNMELRNTTGTLRNVSSAGEPARVFMRSCIGLVDTLIWLLKAAVQQRQAADEKTVENIACILRNLSYRLESEIDPQEGADDVLDREWEKEQRREMDEITRSFQRSPPGCFAFLSRPHPASERRTRPSLPAASPILYVDFANPDSVALPKRNKSVYGMALLWQPEVVYPYLALIEQYNGCAETMEAAAGAIQNLTACNWKWAVYSRNIIRKSNGLRVIGDLLMNGHDAVVRAAATALRNLAIDPRNRASLGMIVIPTIIPRLPFGSNHLGISEETTIALLCLLMELFIDSVENAKLFREKDGIPYLARLSRSRQHTAKIVFAANKVCSILHEYKDCRSALKKEGWELSQYLKLSKETEEQFDFESGSFSRDYHGSGRKVKSSKKRKKSKSKTKMEGFQGVRVEEASADVSHQATQQTTSVQPHSVPQPRVAPYDISDVQDPQYSAITSSEQSPHLTSGGPVAIYQSIEDDDLKGITQGLRTETATSTVSGPLSTTTGGASQEDHEPDPNATYAQVNIEKKRASRKQKEREQQQQEQQSSMDMEAIDSWV